jgi:hypothetical protein
MEYTYYGYYGLVGEVGCIQMQTQGSPFNTVVPYSSISTLYIDLPPKRSKTQQQGCIATPKGSTNLILPLHCEDFLGIFDTSLHLFERLFSTKKMRIFFVALQVATPFESLEPNMALGAGLEVLPLLVLAKTHHAGSESAC